VSFVSPAFYLLLAAAGIGFYLLPGRFRAIYLLALSYAFYAASSRIYLLLLIVASVTTYGLGLGIARTTSDKTKGRLLALGVAAIVGVVIVFKAAGAWRGVLLPLGISYYSFKLISYLIEVYWDEESVERDPALFFLFPAFFPQIVSGPIQRPAAFFDQMRSVMKRSADDAQITTGFGYILGGLMLKLIIGDRLAGFIGVVDQSHNQFSYGVMLATVGLYTLQLYADFAGYTNIALGIGRIFGVEGPPNFAAPFAATNIQIMWRRWHMSLTSWLTDYLFTPLSMAVRDLGQVGVVFSIFVNMVTIGLWHGFTLNFLVFGLVQAVFMTVTVLFLGERARRNRAAGRKATEPNAWVSRSLGLLGAIATFTMMSFSTIFFHSPTWGQAVSILQQVFGVDPSGPLGWSVFEPKLLYPTCLCAAIALYHGCGAPGAERLRVRFATTVPQWLGYGVCLFLLTVLWTDSSGSFVYGQF
jgi:alginate O-acetyltransferase complex protein AlgI